MLQEVKDARPLLQEVKDVSFSSKNFQPNSTWAARLGWKPGLARCEGESSQRVAEHSVPWEVEEVSSLPRVTQLIGGDSGFMDLIAMCEETREQA